MRALCRGCLNSEFVSVDKKEDIVANEVPDYQNCKNSPMALYKQIIIMLTCGIFINSHY